MKTAINRVCQVEVSAEWTDPVTNLQYDFSAKVFLSRDYEVQNIDFLSIDVYDADKPLDRDVAWILATGKTIKEQLESVATEKALEKVQLVDFDGEEI